MSRVSRKSGLSPSITKGSNAIDLGKNSGVDMGRKSQPSVTSGGIGITQEVINAGGMSVSVGGNIDITPLDFGINVNLSEGTVSVATDAEIPGGWLGISGGIEIDMNTGEIIGGSVGGEVGGLGINVSNSKKGGIGIEFTVQIPGTPIEFSLGFSFPSPKDLPSPTPTDPTPTSPKPSMIQQCAGGYWLPWGRYYYFNSETGVYLPHGEWTNTEIIEGPFMQSLKNLTWNSTFHQAPEPPGKFSAASSRAEAGIADLFYGEGNWITTEVSYTGFFPEIRSNGNGSNTTGYVCFWKWSNGGVAIDAVKNKNIAI